MTFDPAAGATETPGAPPADVAPEGSPAGDLGTQEVDEFAPIEGEPDVFPKEYVTRLRNRNASDNVRRREAEERAAALAPLEEVFQGWEPEQVEGWKQFLGQAQENPEGALAALVRDGFALDRESAVALLDTIYEAGGQEPSGLSETPEGDDLDRPLTRREYEEMRQQEDQDKAISQELANINSTAKELGYTPDAKVGSREEFRYQRLLHLTATTTGGDLSKAHEALAAEEQAIVKDSLARMAKEADGAPAAPGDPLTPGAQNGPPRTFKDADAAAAEFMRSGSTS